MCLFPTANNTALFYFRHNSLEAFLNTSSLSLSTEFHDWSPLFMTPIFQTIFLGSSVERWGEKLSSLWRFNLMNVGVWTVILTKVQPSSKTAIPTKVQLSSKPRWTVIPMKVQPLSKRRWTVIPMKVQPSSRWRVNHHPNQGQMHFAPVIPMKVQPSSQWRFDRHPDEGSTVIQMKVNHHPDEGSTVILQPRRFWGKSAGLLKKRVQLFRMP